MNPTRYLTTFCAAALLTACLEPADQIMERYGEGKLIFVKEPSVGGTSMNDNVAMASNPNEFYPGTDIILLSPISPTGKLTNLTAQWTRAVENHNDWGAALDPEVSFDGTRILFSMRKPSTQTSLNQHWGIYEMNVDGTHLVQLTSPEIGDDVDPAYIDATHIVFGSTRNQILDEYERRAVPQLFVGEMGGVGGNLVNVRQITFNQSHDQNPFVHSSGKIFFTRWDHLGDPNKMPLFTVNPDGSGQFVLYGADETFTGSQTSGSRTFLEARELHDGGLVASLMDRASQFEGGAISIVDLSKFTSAPEVLTSSSSPYNTTRNPSNALFKTPYPIMDGGREKILVAESAHEAGNDVKNAYVNYDLFIMDKDGGNLKLIHADPLNNDYDPIVVAPRAFTPKPFAMNPLIADAFKNGVTTGKFFDADVYSRQDNDGHMSAKDLLNGGTDRSKGLAKFVRVIEAVPMSAQYRSMEGVGRTEFEKQHVIGYGDVRADGSLSLEVPANKALHLQTLDENGMMLVNQLQWINVMPGEKRMCTGCHGAREKDQDINYFKIVNDSVVFKPSAGNLLAETKNYLSGFYNAQKVTEHPSARKDTLDFMSLYYPGKTATVQAILNRRCNSCHAVATAKDSGGSLVLENVPDTALNNHSNANVYATLTNDNGYTTAKAGTKLRYATPDGARESPLAWVLLNKQLTDKNETLYRPTSYNHSTLWQKDSTGRINAFAKENVDLLSLIEWMDMGTQFNNSNYTK